MALIVFKQITKSYQEGLRRKKLALKGLSLEIKKGEVFGFLGPNGAGKSTAIKILLNFIFPDSGEVSISGQKVSNPQVRKYLGYLPENPYLYDNLSPQELLLFKGRVCGLTAQQIKKRMDEILSRVNLFQVKKRPLRTFSKGMVQRAGFALALINDPEILILDEPFSGLDPLMRYEALELLLGLKQQGKTIFFSSHILNDIERVCDRIGMLNHGELVYVGNTEDTLNKYGSLENAFLTIIKGNA